MLPGRRPDIFANASKNDDIVYFETPLQKRRLYFSNTDQPAGWQENNELSDLYNFEVRSNSTKGERLCKFVLLPCGYHAIARNDTVFDLKYRRFVI